LSMPPSEYLFQQSNHNFFILSNFIFYLNLKIHTIKNCK